MRTKRSFKPGKMLALGAVMATAACGTTDNPLGPDEGRVRFVLSADDVAEAPGTPSPAAAPSLNGDGEDHDGPFASANVTFSSILARNLDGVLVNVDGMDLPVTLDIVVMDDGREIVLPDGELPAATYDQLVVVMTAVQAVTHDGTTITIEPPGGGWTAIVPICPFDVGEGDTTVVGLKFNVKHAFRWRGNRFWFQPRLSCDAEEDDDGVG